MFMPSKDPAVATLLRASGLQSRNQTVAVRIGGTASLVSHWSGGTKEVHSIVDLKTMQSYPVPENGSGYTAVDRTFGPAGLPLELPSPGYAVVTVTVGSYTATKISIHPDDATKMIPEPAADLDWYERVVLEATASLKSFARLGNAMQETGITADEYAAAKVRLIGKRMLNSQGAITLEGKNQPRKRLYDLGAERGFSRWGATA